MIRWSLEFPLEAKEILISPFIHSSVVTFFKMMLLMGALLGSVVALIMIARKLSEKNVFARILPHLLVLIFFWVVYLFIFSASTEDPPTAVSRPPRFTSGSGRTFDSRKTIDPAGSARRMKTY